MPLPSAILAPHSYSHLRPLQSRAIFPFLSLPAELRRQIYSYLFNEYSISVESYPSLYHHRPSWEAIHGIRLVCWQIHEETTEFIFEHVRVKIGCIGWITHLAGKLAIKTSLEANRRRIRSFRLDVMPLKGLDDVTESYLV